jgi:organic hydroperoxide reductase OsmC/OhrA
MPRTHTYSVENVWTGNRGSGTSDYRAYGREHEISGEGKSAAILCSSQPLFRGNRERYNPEELLLSALSGCHMLWYLHFCADAGIRVVSYRDSATAIMQEEADGSGRVTDVLLRPVIEIEGGDLDLALHLHDKVHEVCAVGRSVNFQVRVEPQIREIR